MDDPLKNLPGYLLRRVSNALQDEFSALLSELDLRPSDASTLVLIDANPKITPSALGQTLGIQRANMVPIITRLEKNMLIRRVPLNGRSYGIIFTGRGSEAFAQVKQIIDLHETEIIDRIPEASRHHFITALEALWQN